jgi:alpha-amylase/alpha-mannosidase (GH57 family)
LTSRLPVVLLWHMHQPQYRDALTGQYVLPWTYLHAIKDYTDMAAHLEANPAARAVVNFTPVLIEQLQELAERIAGHLRHGNPLPDPVLRLLGPGPVTHEPTERLALMQACMRAQRKQMIERFGPYLELVTLASSFATLQRVCYASDRLINDLAVWYHIAWLGETVRRTDARVATLTEQGRAYTGQQRHELLALVGELVQGVVPRFRKLAERGQCELSMTPYGHPIVPLLLDFSSARESMPAVELPRHPQYSNGAARAAWHMEHGLEVFTSAFGVRPVGCWPSEGAISEDTLKLLDRFGFQWAASSTSVLRNSLGPQAPLDVPYQMRSQRLTCFFRDDALSDRIGFTYATWHGDDAARNFVEELARLAEKYAGEPNRAVLVALDGENAWEHYPFNGYYFLRKLYSELSAHPLLELTTLSACVARGLEAKPLERVAAGSWVHGTLATWMGDRDKNKAWDLLCDAKEAFDHAMTRSSLNEAQRFAAERQLALCESSDWFWWFGDYNPADAVKQFDELFRHQLGVLYRLLQAEPPATLEHPISVGRGAPEHGGVMRRADVELADL